MTRARPIAGEEALAEIAAAIGEDGATRLAQRLGGTTVSVPRAIGENHPLRVVLGAELADRLAAWCGGSRLSVPKQVERRARVIALRRTGSLTVAAIALETGYSERHVYRLLSEHDDRQMDLFGE
jgi:AraC-like DNA-binding protein